MTDEYLRQYEPEELGPDGYPRLWNQGADVITVGHQVHRVEAIKDYVRAQAGHRCVRCGHPYPPGVAKEHPRGEWTLCDEECSHGGPVRFLTSQDWHDEVDWETASKEAVKTARMETAWMEARYRILTVHHLDGDKANCRWWNLLPLCQRCHLQVQGKVVPSRPWPWAHSEWFEAYVAGFYAWRYLGEEVGRDEVEERLEELLALGAREDAVERMPL